MPMAIEPKAWFRTLAGLTALLGAVSAPAYAD